ncbi:MULTISPECIES: hypothetical protein [unclassified Aeromicrobium]|uniref:hypothetical protein n=1 Tax=unclassified Aeromicrobium TaxID=2633570 RepID=UPI000AD90646|nr:MULTISPECIES: hypothetical protein [unclassified Aeromicrobium]
MTDQPSKRPLLPAFPALTVALTDLQLDLRNSRFSRDAHDQADALELMLTIAGEQCMELLRDISRAGRLNSADPLIVLQDDSGFVVLEGNRRTTVLKLWTDPGSVRDSTLARRFRSRVERLAQESNFSPPTHVQVVVAPSEEEAEPWIDLKHSSGNGGVGTVPWGAAMKDRRLARSDPSKTTRAAAFVGLVSDQLGHVPDLQADLEVVRDKRYTMIKRFVDRSIVRELLGLEFADGRMTFLHGAEATAPILRRVISDFAQDKAPSGKTWARELDTVSDFEAYLYTYRHLLPVPPTSQGEPEQDGGQPAPDPAPDGVDGPADGEATSSSGPGRPGRPGVGGPAESQSEDDEGRRPRPTPADDRIFRGLNLDQFPPRVQEITRQVSLLDVSSRYEVVAITLRVVLELTTHHFLKKTGVVEPPRYLDKLLRQAIKTLEPQAASELREAEVTSELSKAYHATTNNEIRLLQYALHDQSASRTASESIAIARRYQPLLVAMNDWLREDDA